MGNDSKVNELQRKIKIRQKEQTSDDMVLNGVKEERTREERMSTSMSADGKLTVPTKAAHTATKHTSPKPSHKTDLEASKPKAVFPDFKLDCEDD